MSLTTLTPRDRVRDLVYRYGLLVLLVVLVVFFATTQPSFGTWRNVLIILQSVAITAIVALGVTVSLSVNGFDLSIGSTISFVVMLTAAAQVYWNLGPWIAVLLGLLAGVGIGLVNGFLIVVARVPDLLATLATMFVFAGLALVLTSGQSVSTGSTINGQPAPGAISPEFLWLGRGNIFGVPITVIVMVVLGIVISLLLSRTRTGRLFGAIGGNPEAARLAGVHVGRNKVLAYAISGLLASIGAILLTARLGRGDVGVGGGYLLETVAAALIGFAVLGANKANGFGTVVGAIFVGVVLNGLTMMNLPYYTQDLIKGLLLLGALVLSFSGLFKRKDS